MVQELFKEIFLPIVLVLITSAASIFTWNLARKESNRQNALKQAKSDADMQRLKDDIETKLWTRVSSELDEEREQRKEAQRLLRIFQRGVLILIRQIETELGAIAKWYPPENGQSKE